MSQFTIIENPSVKETSNASAPRGVETGRAVDLLTDRQIHMVKADAAAAIPLVRADTGAVILGGVSALRELPNFKQQHPGTPIMVEPAALSQQWATGAQPFFTEPDNCTRSPLSLSNMLDLQRDQGADLAMTPSGQVRVGDVAALEAIINRSNSLDRTDTLVAVIADANWLSDPVRADQLSLEINRSRHPVALSFSSKGRPLESVKRVNAFRRLVAECQVPLMMHRVGVAGFEALALGALASSIGANPAGRQSTPPGTDVRIKDRDRSFVPQILVGDLLEFISSIKMGHEWFAAALPFTCSCAVCNGAAIDRFSASTDDRLSGHMHNIMEIDRIYASLSEVGRSDRALNWRNMVLGARDSYAQLREHVGKAIVPPALLSVWSEPIPS